MIRADQFDMFHFGDRVRHFHHPIRQSTDIQFLRNNRQFTQLTFRPFQQIIQ